MENPLEFERAALYLALVWMEPDEDVGEMFWEMHEAMMEGLDAATKARVEVAAQTIAETLYRLSEDVKGKAEVLMVKAPREAITKALRGRKPHFCRYWQVARGGAKRIGRSTALATR